MKIKLTIIVMALAICLQQGYTREKEKVKVDFKKDSVKHVTSIGSSLNNSSSGNIGKSNVATFDMSEVKDINGRYCHNGTDKLVSGRVIKMKKGVKEYEFHLKDGIKHGRFRHWNNIESAPWPALDAVFDMGELVKFQEWWSYDVENSSPQLNLKVWEGSTSPWQVIKEGWNRDGTPTKPGTEK
jgi:hypothetical protein